MNAVDYFIAACDEHPGEVQWNLHFDPTVQTPELRYEVRAWNVYDNEPRLRVIEQGVTLYEAAGKAVVAVAGAEGEGPPPAEWRAVVEGQRS